MTQLNVIFIENIVVKNFRAFIGAIQIQTFNSLKIINSSFTGAWVIGAFSGLTDLVGGALGVNKYNIIYAVSVDMLNGKTDMKGGGFSAGDNNIIFIKKSDICGGVFIKNNSTVVFSEYKFTTNNGALGGFLWIG